MIKKIFLIIAVFILLMTVVLGVFAYKNREKWETYNNDLYKFSITFPSSWSLKYTQQDNTGFNFTAPDKKSACRVYGFANSIKNKDGKIQTLDEFVDWIAANLIKDEVISKTNTAMAGLAAKELIMRKGESYSQGVYIVGNETGRGFICSFSNSTTKKSFENNFKKIQSSFVMTGSLDKDISKNKTINPAK